MSDSSLHGASSTTDASQSNGSSGSDDDQGSAENNSEDSGENKGKNWLEWTVTVAGALLVLFVVGFLTYQWVSNSGEPANLQVTLGTPSQDGSTVEIPVEVRNDGQKVAEAAVIEVCAGPETCAQLTFDYVPFQSKVTGSVGLEAPLAAPPSSRVVSFRNP